MSEPKTSGHCGPDASGHCGPKASGRCGPGARRRHQRRRLEGDKG